MKNNFCKNMKNKKALAIFIRSVSSTIFIIFILICLIIAVLMLNKALLIAADTTIDDSNSSMQFDQTTIDHISNLRTSNDSIINLSFPNGRNNPFVE